MEAIRMRVRGRPRQLAPVAVGLSLLLGGMAGASTAGASAVASAPARADAGAPPWWRGACDSGDNPGSYPLGASYNGVVACGPGSLGQGGTDHLVRFFPGAWGEYEWECVELVMRYMYLVYGVVPYKANGGTVVSNYRGNVLTRISNDGSSLPAPGDIISFVGVNGNPDGHTAVVTAVNVARGSGTLTVMQQNATSSGWGTVTVAGGKITGKVLGGGVAAWLHHQGAGAPSPSIIKVRKTIARDGTQQVYFATTSVVYEAWWNRSSAVHRAELISIAAGGIVDIDKITQPDGTQSLYTAVPDGVWETYWNSRTNGPRSAKIISGLSGVTHVIATSEVDSGVYTHVLYVLTSGGPYRFWWQDGGNGIHSVLLARIASPVAFAADQTPGKTDQVYTATAGAVYETWWNPGRRATTDRIIGISQDYITGVSKAIAANGTQELYTSTPYGVWQSEWGGSVGKLTNAYVVSNFSGSEGVKKIFAADGTDQLYVANGSQVKQHWWNRSARGGATLITISQADISSFDVDNYDGLGQLYTAAGAGVYETWWNSSGIHSRSIASAKP